jgi:deoxyribodipyrimidine photo-lyase
VKPQLVWFRNDLRIHDNPALFNAYKTGQPLIAIYIATPEQWLKHDDAMAKIDFWHRNLQCLQKDLAELNITLHFFQVSSYQHIPELISSICQQWQIDSLHLNLEYPVNEQQRDHRVFTACQQLSVHYHGYHDQLLVPPKSIRTQSGQAFKVFTPFCKQVRAQLPLEPTVLPSPSMQPPIDIKRLAEECDLNQISWPSVSKLIQTTWPAGEHTAQSNLIQFCQSGMIRSYKQNRDIPFIRGTSFLSPYLASGVISIKQCWLATSQYCEPSDAVTIWQNELIWREFYKHVLIDYPRVSKHKPWKLNTNTIAWRNDPTELEAWQQGRTGYPLIDAAMKQLLTHGWMHNRLRMITGMFLSKHLLIDWRLGEQWFMQHLIDGELAANNGGWQWCASTGTDSVPYFRLFNPITQSQRFDPEGQFIRHYLPELATLSDKEIHFPGKNRPETYPEPIVDLAYGRQRALTTFKNNDLNTEMS